MENIDIKTRIKNPAFWVGLFGVVASPILAYNGLTFSDLTTWDGLGELIVSFVGNPFLIGSVITAVLGFLGVVVDPTTPGLTDGVQTKGDASDEN